jgi:hypothetical protein|tara:strand:- start:476 stop:661 length:186 start_codon:yes stop_codon:yes gene_type:complete
VIPPVLYEIGSDLAVQRSALFRELDWRGAVVRELFWWKKEKEKRREGGENSRYVMDGWRVR